MAVSLELLRGIAVIRIDESSDSLLPDVRALLPAAVHARALVLVLEGGACGDDIKRLVRSSAAQREVVSAALRGVRDEVANLPVPVVAAIGGSASGEAAELAMACDLRVLVARRATAVEALRTGLVDRVVPPGAVLGTAVELANECKSAQAARKSCRTVSP